MKINKFYTCVIIYVIGYVSTIFLLAGDDVKYQKAKYPTISPSPTHSMAGAVLLAPFWPIVVPTSYYLKYVSGNEFLAGGVKR